MLETRLDRVVSQTLGETYRIMGESHFFELVNLESLRIAYKKINQQINGTHILLPDTNTLMPPIYELKDGKFVFKEFFSFFERGKSTGEAADYIKEHRRILFNILFNNLMGSQNMYLAERIKQEASVLLEDMEKLVDRFEIKAREEKETQREVEKMKKKYREGFKPAHKKIASYEKIATVFGAYSHRLKDFLEDTHIVKDSCGDDRLTYVITMLAQRILSSKKISRGIENDVSFLKTAIGLAASPDSVVHVVSRDKDMYSLIGNKDLQEEKKKCAAGQVNLHHFYFNKERRCMDEVQLQI